MTKKKPDFLRDLDTAIMDELTGGGIKGNAAGLVGTLTQIKEIKQLCGLPFCGYMAKLETVRPSGVPDEVTVVFAEDVPYRACNGIEFDVMQEFVEGSRLLLTGKVQTLKDFQSGRLLVYILADFVAVSEKAVEQDETAVRGVIANKPTYREIVLQRNCGRQQRHRERKRRRRNNRRGKQGSRAGKLDTARLLYIAVVLLRYREREAWRKTPYQITTLFKYHKEYNPHIFRQEQAGTPAATENMDDIDIALGGF